VAWFPDEGVIRFLGPDCFKALNAEAHDESVSRMRAEEKRRADLSYLLKHYDKVAITIAGLKEALPVAVALDTARMAVLNRLRLIKMNLWPHIRQGGKLMVSRRETEVTISRSGEHGSREIEVDRPYATLSGFEFFDPDAKLVARQLRAAIHALEAVDYVGSDVQTRFNALGEADRSMITKLMSRGLNGAQTALSKLADIRRGASIESTATLRNWSRELGSPLPGLYIRRDGNNLNIGKSEYFVVRIDLGAALDSTLPLLPNLIVSEREEGA